MKDTIQSRYQQNGFAKLRDKAKLESSADKFTFAQAMAIGPGLIAKLKERGLVSFKAGVPDNYKCNRKK